MTGRVNDAHFNAMAGNSVTILHKLIDSAGLGDGNSCPLRLHIELFKQKQVGFMNRSRHTQSLLQIRNRRSEEHTSELQSRLHLVCRLLLEKKKKQETIRNNN